MLQVGTLGVEVQLDRAVRTVSFTEFEELVHDGFVGPHTPVRPEGAETFIPASALERYQRAAESPLVALRRRWTHPPVVWMTALLVAINLQIYLWLVGTELYEALVLRFGRSSSAILESGEGWRIFSYGLLHGSIEHLVMNVLMIAYTGYFLERVIGPWALGAVFWSAVAAGGALATFGNPEALSIGASGGDFGLLAAAVVTGWRYDGLLPGRARVVFGAVILVFTIWVFLNGLASERTDNWGHLGGLIAGVLVMPFLRPEVGGPDSPERRRNRRVSGVALGVSLAVAATLSLAGPGLLVLVEGKEDGLIWSRPAAWAPGYAATGGLGARSASTPMVVVGGTSPSRGQDLDALLAEELSIYRGFYPDAQIARLPELERDGHRVTPFRVTWQDEGEGRNTDGLLLVRGDFVSSARVESEQGWLAERLVARLLDQVRFPPLDVETEAKRSFVEDSWRAQLGLAKAMLATGALSEACVALDQASRLAPAEPVVVEDGLPIRVRCAPERVEAEARAALVRFPGDHRVLIGVARALAAVGRVDEARALAVAAAAEAPKNRALQRLAAELAPP